METAAKEHNGSVSATPMVEAARNSKGLTFREAGASRRSPGRRRIRIAGEDVTCHAFRLDDFHISASWRFALADCACQWHTMFRIRLTLLRTPSAWKGRPTGTSPIFKNDSNFDFSRSASLVLPSNLKNRSPADAIAPRMDFCGARRMRRAGWISTKLPLTLPIEIGLTAASKSFGSISGKCGSRQPAIHVSQHISGKRRQGDDGDFHVLRSIFHNKRRLARWGSFILPGCQRKRVICDSSGEESQAIRTAGETNQMRIRESPDGRAVVGLRSEQRRSVSRRAQCLDVPAASLRPANGAALIFPTRGPRSWPFHRRSSAICLFRQLTGRDRRHAHLAAPSVDVRKHRSFQGLGPENQLLTYRAQAARRRHESLRSAFRSPALASSLRPATRWAESRIGELDRL